MRRKKVYDAIKIWGLKAKKVRRFKGLFKIWTDKGLYCLKPVKDNRARLYFFNSVIKHIQSQGFQRLTPYIPTVEGEPYGVYDEESFILIPWIDGKQIRYRSAKEIIGAAKLLAQYHNAVEGYQAEPGIKVKDKLGKWPEKLAKRVGDIEYYIQLARSEGTEFDNYFLENADWILADTTKSFVELRDSEYYQKVEEAKEKGHICHGDPAKRNFLIDKRDQLYLIDFDSMKRDIFITDVWRLLRRTLSRDQWDIHLVDQILESYQEMRSLDQAEYKLLWIYLKFPEKIWRTLRKFYEKRGREGWSYDKLFKKLRKLVEQNQSRAAFLKEFEEKYLKE